MVHKLLQVYHMILPVNGEKLQLILMMMMMVMILIILIIITTTATWWYEHV
jgi:hypothetical protein